MAKTRYIPLNCSKCGCFVGKDGYHDVGYDYYNGGYDVGYPLCKKCLDRSNTKNTLCDKKIIIRKEKALQTNDYRDVNGKIEVRYDNGTWHECCPLFADCGNDDLDEYTCKTYKVAVIGCRGITCQECWSKEI